MMAVLHAAARGILFQRLGAAALATLLVLGFWQPTTPPATAALSLPAPSQNLSGDTKVMIFAAPANQPGRWQMASAFRDGARHRGGRPTEHPARLHPTHNGG